MVPTKNAASALTLLATLVLGLAACEPRDTTAPASFDRDRQVGDVVSFQGNVAAADPDETDPTGKTGTFTLRNKTTVRVTSETFVDPAGDVQSLRELADAIAAGERAVSQGTGTVETVRPLVLTASEVKWELK